MQNEIQESQLSDTEFKELVIRKLNELTENYQKLQGNYNELTANYINMKKETETIKKGPISLRLEWEVTERGARAEQVALFPL